MDILVQKRDDGKYAAVIYGTYLIESDETKLNEKILEKLKEEEARILKAHENVKARIETLNKKKMTYKEKLEFLKDHYGTGTIAGSKLLYLARGDLDKAREIIENNAPDLIDFAFMYRKTEEAGLL